MGTSGITINRSFRLLYADFKGFRQTAGGESGIRSRSAPLGSVSCRKHYAVVAKNAMNPTPHCPLLPAGESPILALCRIQKRNAWRSALEDDFRTFLLCPRGFEVQKPDQSSLNPAVESQLPAWPWSARNNAKPSGKPCHKATFDYLSCVGSSTRRLNSAASVGYPRTQSRSQIWIRTVRSAALVIRRLTIAST